MKTRLFAGISLAIGSIVSLVGAELILAYPVYYLLRGETYYSSLRKNSVYLFQADEFIGFTLSPNLNRKSAPTYANRHAPRSAVFYDFQTNAQGFRYSANLSMPKAPGEIRVFSLGASTTQGAESPNNFTYPQLTEDIVKQKFKHAKVINAGVGGYRSIHLKRYYEKVIRPYEPDVITVYEGWNDFEDSLLGYWAPGDPFGHALTTQFFLYGKDGASWLRILRKLALFNLGAKTYFALTNKNRLEAESAAATNFLDGAKRDAWIAEYYKNISALVKEALDDGVLPVIINPASPVFELASGEVRAWADEDLNMNGRWDAFVLARKRIYETNKRIATENQIPLVEVNKAFDRYNADYRSKFALFTDRFHLTNEGNKLIAETLAPQLLEILRQKRTDSPRTGAL